MSDDVPRITDEDRRQARIMFDGQPTGLVVTRESQDYLMLRFAEECCAARRELLQLRASYAALTVKWEGTEAWKQIDRQENHIAALHLRDQQKTQTITALEAQLAALLSQREELAKCVKRALAEVSRVQYSRKMVIAILESDNDSKLQQQGE